MTGVYGTVDDGVVVAGTTVGVVGVVVVGVTTGILGVGVAGVAGVPDGTNSDGSMVAAWLGHVGGLGSVPFLYTQGGVGEFCDQSPSFAALAVSCA